MSQPDSRKEQAKTAFLAGETIAAIAQKLEVSRRTIERWADEGAWREQRNVVPLVKPQARPVQETGAARPRRQRGGIDELEIVDGAISTISIAMMVSVDDEGNPVQPDPRSLGSCASGLCRLIELRNKLAPKTLTQLAEMAIGLGYTPDNFLQELAKAWQARA